MATRSKKMRTRDELSAHPTATPRGDAGNMGEVRKYLESVLGPFKELQYLVQTARSTPRQKVAEATVSVFLARAQSLLQYIACGGECAPVEVQEAIFTPVLDFWSNLYGPGAKDSDEDK